MAKGKNYHFMGIGGSGMSAAALMAKKQGFNVTGCDVNSDTPYLQEVKKEIPVATGHDVDHLEDTDVLVTTPAVLFQDIENSELKRAKQKLSIMTWQEFVGRNLLPDMEVIAIAGTHGKSTTTAMASLVFEAAGLDPSVIIGATVKEWRVNFRTGKSNRFIIEADEFYDNYLSYHPRTVILNNIEFDHPDYFPSENSVFESFRKFIKSIIGDRRIILNADDPGISRLFKGFTADELAMYDLYGYSLSGEPKIRLRKMFTARIIKKASEGTEFIVSGFGEMHTRFQLNLPGEHNVANALGVIVLARIFGIPADKTAKALASFSGIGRRLEYLGSVSGVRIYDDYAHHPTAIKATLGALKQKHSKEKLWAVIEPHSFSRTKALLKEYRDAFIDADSVIVGPIYKARDTHDHGVNSEMLVDVSAHNDACSLVNIDKITQHLAKKVSEGDVVVVMGAGKSYDWARQIKRGIFATGLKNKLIINEPLSRHTTLGIGGPAKIFVTVSDEDELCDLVKKAQSANINFLVIGSGSNLLINDGGYDGLIIHNECRGIKKRGNVVSVNSGVLLKDFIEYTLLNGLAGLEALTGIPGTVGGAIHGNAGAYGQSISDHLIRVKACNGRETKYFSRDECRFAYRESAFKDNGFVVLSAEFTLDKGDAKALTAKSAEIADIRNAKYPPGVACPGSFFKNVLLDKLSAEALKRIPEDKIIFGKVPAGYLLEAVGAKGMALGGIKIADYHANLFINTGNGTAAEFLRLADNLAAKVADTFTVTLEPEVEYI